MGKTVRQFLRRARVEHATQVLTDGWQKTDLERDKKFVAAQKLIEGADEVFVNGDSFIPDARPQEPVFKARMFAEMRA